MREKEKRRRERDTHILLLRTRAVYEWVESLPLPNLSGFL